MSKFILIALFFSFNSLMAKTIELDVFTYKNEITNDISEDQLLKLNGFRQIVTNELENLKLDSSLFWEKLSEKQGQSKKVELEYLQSFFSKDLISREATPVSSGDKPKENISDVEKLNARLSTEFSLERLQTSYKELIENLTETKLKTFYLYANVDLDPSLSWEDMGVSKAENFSGAIIKSWKDLFQKELKDFEKVVVLEKDFREKPDYMNAKSVTLKWTSTFKKIGFNAEKKTMSYELDAHTVLVNTKSGQVLSSFDFPIQKRDFDVQNKKALSSSLASLVYNLVYSQRTKLVSLLETEAKNEEHTQVEVKILTKSSLSEIYLINNFLQEKFVQLKLTSQMKSFSTDGATLLINAVGTEEKILDSLSLEGGKFPLNEQKVLLFNRTDKSFAILPKDSNNKN